MSTTELLILRSKELIQLGLGFNENKISLISNNEIELCNKSFYVFKFNVELYDSINIEIELYWNINRDFTNIYLNVDENFRSDLRDIRNSKLDKFEELSDEEKIRWKLLFIGQINKYDEIEINKISSYIIKLLVEKLSGK